MDGISDKKEKNCNFEHLIMFLSKTFINKQKPWSASSDKDAMLWYRHLRNSSTWYETTTLFCLPTI